MLPQRKPASSPSTKSHPSYRNPQLKRPSHQNLFRENPLSKECHTWKETSRPVSLMVVVYWWELELSRGKDSQSRCRKPLNAELRLALLLWPSVQYSFDYRTPERHFTVVAILVIINIFPHILGFLVRHTPLRILQQ